MTEVGAAQPQSVALGPSAAALTRGIPALIVWAIAASLLCWLSYSELLHTANFAPAWDALYAAAFIAIIWRIRQGGVVDPLVIIGTSYLFLLSAGTLVFEYVQGRLFDLFNANLVGLGFAAFLLGLFVGRRYRLVGGETAAGPGTPQPLQSPGALWFMVGVTLAATAALFLKFGQIPLFAGDVNDAKYAMIAGSGYLNVCFVGAQVLTLLVLHHFVSLEDRRKVWRAHGLAIVVAVALVLSGWRGKTLIFVAAYGGMYLLHNPQRIRLRWIIIAPIAVITFLSVMGAYRRNGTVSLSGAAQELGIVLTTRPATMMLIVHNLDESERLGFSRYFGDLEKLMPGQQSGGNVDLKYLVFSHPERMPDLAGITPSVVGEAYMSFGSGGVFWVCIGLGALLGALYRRMCSAPSFGREASYLIVLLAMASGVQSGLGVQVVHLLYLLFWTAVATLLNRWHVH